MTDNNKRSLEELRFFVSNNTELMCELEKGLVESYDGCNYDFDKLLCWPPTPSDSWAVQPCFSQLNGIDYDINQNATRYCTPNGTWNSYTDYSKCKELESLELSGIEITTTIYIVGYFISLAALMIAVYIFLRFKDLRCLRNSIHMNLMLSYILSNASWLLTYAIQILVYTDRASCIFFIVVLHYFHLTNFFWMFVEGLYLYILVAKTFTGKHITLRVYAFIGWGCPAFCVLIWGIAKSFTLETEEEQIFEDGTISCPWTPHVFDWIYQAPVIGVLVINMMFLIIIMWVLITKLRSANSAETQQYRKAAKALLVLIPLLGITYIIVLVGPAKGISGKIYGYLRAVLLSTQGFTVALFYCFLNAEVKNTIRHHFNSWTTRRTLGSRKTRFSTSRTSSAKSPGDSLRLYQGSKLYKKRESTCSVGTTTTLVTLHPSKPNTSRNYFLTTEMG